MQTFTLKRKGITFDSPFDSIEDARDVLAESQLNGEISSNEFVVTLLTKPKLSEQQIAWLHYLATESQKKDDEVVESVEEVVESGEYASLVKKMYEGVKSPKRKFTLRLPSQITISTVTSGSNVGYVYVFENKNYVGKVSPDGVLFGDFSEDAKNILYEANENLFELAKIYGHETGSCSVCGRELSDPLSIQMGIGPICAKRFK